jgi:hypothetical protein
MNSRAASRRGAAPSNHPRLASESAARSKSGLLRPVSRIALYGAIGFIIGSIVLVALYRVLPPPGTPRDGAATWRRINVAVGQLANNTPPGLVH